MTNTTYYPRWIVHQGKHMMMVVELSGSIGNIAACKEYVKNLKARLKFEGLPYVVRRFHTCYVTYK